METVTLIILTLFIIFAGLMLLVGSDISQFQKIMIKVRQQKEYLLQEVYKYRLSKMLSYIGVSIEDYVLKIPDTEINTHIKRCKACPNIPTCDSCLRDGKFVSDMHFCPNYRSLMKCSKIMPSTG